MGHPHRPLAERFADKFCPEPNTGCWLWTAAVNKPLGYGLIGVGGRSRLAHRVSWELHRGPIPEGLDVLHRCDTPPCVNPDHLFLGTLLENNADKVEKDRQARGMDFPWVKLSPEKVVEMRRMRASGALLKEIAREVGCSVPTASEVLNGKYWRHVA